MTTSNANADFDRDMDVDAADDAAFDAADVAAFDAARGTAALPLGAVADDAVTGTRNPVGRCGLCGSRLL